MFDLARILEAVEEDTAFDQICHYACRVGTHAVYCHNNEWWHHPRKCKAPQWCEGFELNKNIRGIKNMDLEQIFALYALEFGHTNTNRVRKEFKEIESGMELPDGLPEEIKNRLVMEEFLKVNEETLKAHKIYDEIVGYMEKEPEPEDDTEDEETEENSWKTVFKNTPNPKKRSKDMEYDNLPSLIIVDRIIYDLKIINPKEGPRPVSGVNKFGDSYDKYVFDVKLLGVSDDSLYDEEDNKGNPMAEKGKDYTLWLNKRREFKDFKKMWADAGHKVPTTETFSMKKFKRKSKKGFNYNVFEFMLK